MGAATGHIPRVERRAAGAVAAAALLLGGLLAGSCASPQARFSTIADLPEEMHGALMLVDAGQSSSGHRLVRVQIGQRLEGGLPDRPVLIPFRDERPGAPEGQRGRPVVPIRVWSMQGDRSVGLSAVVDTGAASSLILSSATGAEVGAWLSSEIGPHDGVGFVGRVPSGQGLVRRLEVGPIVLSPAEVKVNTAQSGRSASLGLSAFMAFGGLVFDWERSVMVALPRGRPVHVEPGWVEVEWSPSPTAELTPLEGGAGWRIVPDFSGMPVARARVGGATLRAVLDTGGDGEFASLRELPVEGRGRARLVSSHGRVTTMREHRLDGRVDLGGVWFDRPIVVVPDPESEGDEELLAPLRYLDAVVGVELLRRQPVWFDFERGVVRFWMGGDALPGLTPGRVLGGGAE